MGKFHDNEFDAATLLKLKLFHGYIEKWLPVFMTKRKHSNHNIQHINVFDFFSGPGCDNNGKPGSPKIIVNEVKRYCIAHSDKKDNDVEIRLFFNDKDKEHIDTLERGIGRTGCEKKCCTIEYSAKLFRENFLERLPLIQDKSSANLVIMDQCGVKEVTEKVLTSLTECQATDVLFFISSFSIKRFIKTKEFSSKFTDLDPEKIDDVEYRHIHRYICDYFQGMIKRKDYHLSPFSIKKGSNINGVIFGSGHLYGLGKFLEVCWKEDDVTGEANYNIDHDFAWGRQKSIFKEANVIKKVDVFEKRMKQYIKDSKPNNHELYKFCLTNGFLPTHITNTLRAMRKTGELEVINLGTSKPTGHFYLNWDNYKKPPSVRFELGEEA